MSRKTELTRELHWRRCAADPSYLARSFWKIQHPAHGAILFKLTPEQEIGLAHWREHRYSLTLKARQIGWSTLVGLYSFWTAYFQPDRKIIMLSRTERESIKLLGKAKYGYKRLPQWMTERGPKMASDHQQQMVFSNGSEIISLPSASDPARGESASIIVVDEWAFLPNPEEAWASIEPVADVGGSIIGLSTANGSGNFFYSLWQGAESGANNFKTMFMPWYSAANRKKRNGEPDWDWYADKQKNTLSWQLAQEYPTTAEEAFIKSGNPVFDVERLQAMKAEAVEPMHAQFVKLGA